MSITLPTGDQHIDMLLVELTTLVNNHGKESYQVQTFIEKHEDDHWMDRKTGITHFFSEIGEPLSELIGGIENKEGPEEPDESDAADWWKSGATPEDD